MKNDKDDFQMTAEEMRKFEKAFKDPEFVELFKAYASEVSSPEALRETDTYLRQLEAEGRGEEMYGAGVRLIAPEAAFVLKMLRTDAAKGEKVYVNVCTSSKIEPATAPTIASKDQGNRRIPFHVPYALSPMRSGEDSHSKPCTVWDFIVHPDTVAMARGRQPIMNLLANVARERIEQVHESMKLQQKFATPKMKYKKTPNAERPPVLSLRAINSEQDQKPTSDQSCPKNSNKAKKYEENKSKQPSSRSAFSFGSGKEKGSNTENSLGNQEYAEKVPSWEVIERGEVDLASSWKDYGRNLQATRSIPKELCVRIQLPGISSAQGIQLDVSCRSFSLLIPQRFRLQIKLRYTVIEDKAKALFDRAKQQMEVILPVDIRNCSSAPCQTNIQLSSEEPSKGVEDLKLSKQDKTAPEIQDNEHSRGQPLAGFDDSDEGLASTGGEKAASAAVLSNSSICRAGEVQHLIRESQLSNIGSSSATTLTANELKWQQIHNTNEDVVEREKNIQDIVQDKLEVAGMAKSCDSTEAGDQSWTSGYRVDAPTCSLWQSR